MLDFPALRMLCAAVLSLPAPIAVAAQVEAATCSLQGSCVARGSGVPLEGATVTVTSCRKLGVPVAGMRPATVTTTASGTFELTLAPPVGSLVLVRIEHAGRRAASYTARASELGATCRLDVALERGASVVGRLHDEDGKPVVGSVTLFVSSDVAIRRPGGPSLRPDQPRSPFRAVPDPQSQRNRFQNVSIFEAKTAADGTFRFEERVPAGLGRLEVAVRGMHPLHERRYDFVDGVPARLDVAMRAYPHLSGVVVDDRGDPVAGVLLRAENDRYGPAMEGETDAQGRFVIVRSGPAPESVPIRVLDGGRCEPGKAQGPFGWGSRDLRLRLARLPTVELRVVAARDGQPVEDFAIRSIGEKPTRRATHLQSAGHHPRGRLQVPVARGRARIFVVPEDRRLLPISIDVTGDDDMQPIVVRLQRMVPMQVDVVDRSGEPREGCRVAVVVPGTYRNRDAVIDARERRLQLWTRNLDDRFSTVVYEAQTDAGGRCIVFAPDRAAPLRLRVSRSARAHRWIENVQVRDGVRVLEW